MPRPRWPLIVTSTVFIGGCLFFGGVTLSGFGHWDPCAWVVAVIFTGPSFGIAYWQYAAAFRAHESSASILRYLLPMMGAGGLLVAVLAVLEPLSEGVTPTNDYIAGLVLPLVLVGIWFGWVGFLNFRWHRQLTAAPVLATLVEDHVTAPTPGGRFRISLGQSLALIAALSAVLAGATFGYRDIPPQIAMHVSPHEARLRSLPTGATDVCIWRGYRGTITYNFAIDETGFWEWTKSIGGSLESQASGVKIMPVTASIEIYDPFARNGAHTITRGWFYDFHVEDRGLQYAYDAVQCRAYFSFHSY
jgi:hypothetical protein